MKYVVAKFVLRLLLPEQKEHRAAVANDLIQIITNGPDFLKKIITGDELSVPALKRAKASLCYVQCFLYLISSSINISIFYSV